MFLLWSWFIPEGCGSRAPGQLTLTEVYFPQLQKWEGQGQGTSDSVSKWEWFVVCTSCSLLCGKEAGDLSGTTFIGSSILLKSTLTSCPDHLPNVSSPTINPSWNLGLQHMSFGWTNVQSIRNTVIRKVWEEMRGVCLGSVLIYTSGCVITHRGAIPCGQFHEWQLVILLVGDTVTTRVSPSHTKGTAVFCGAQTGPYSPMSLSMMTRSSARIKAYFCLL